MNNTKTTSKHHTKKKKVKKVKKKIEEAPPPDLTSENAKIEMIQALLLKTDLNEEELNEAYDVFYSKYPEGELNEDQFLRESKVRSQTVESWQYLYIQAGVMAQSLFRVFDEDHSGKLTFYEFVQANNVRNLDTPEDKLGWMFDAFDADGGGTVDADEINDIVVGLFRLGGIEEDQDLLAACVFDVLEAVDQEGDGEISKDEFVKNAMKCKFIFNMLKSKNK